ncbi:hypothetical protein D9M69_514020 [compost metagenome]
MLPIIGTVGRADRPYQFARVQLLLYKVAPRQADTDFLLDRIQQHGKMAEIHRFLGSRCIESDLLQPERPIDRHPKLRFPVACAEVQQCDAHQPVQRGDLRVLLEKAGCTDREYLFGEQVLGHIVRMLLQPQGHRGIEALLVVRVALGTDQMQLQFRVLGPQLLEPRHQP